MLFCWLPLELDWGTSAILARDAAQWPSPYTARCRITSRLAIVLSRITLVATSRHYYIVTVGDVLSLRSCVLSKESQISDSSSTKQPDVMP